VGVPKIDVLGEGNSRDTFESAVEVEKLLRQKGWKRYLLVTSAAHMREACSLSKPKHRIPSQRLGISRWQIRAGTFHFFPGESAARESLSPCTSMLDW